MFAPRLRKTKPNNSPPLHFPNILDFGGLWHVFFPLLIPSLQSGLTGARISCTSFEDFLFSACLSPIAYSTHIFLFFNLNSINQHIVQHSATHPTILSWCPTIKSLLRFVSCYLSESKQGTSPPPTQSSTPGSRWKLLPYTV